MAIVAGLVPSSCSTSKHPTAQQHAPSIIIATSSESLTNKNLGELQMTNHHEFFVNLGAGKSCTIRPTLLNRNNLQLMVALESKNANGVVNGLSVVKVVNKSGETFEVTVGDMNLTLTPMLATE